MEPILRHREEYHVRQVILAVLMGGMSTTVANAQDLEAAARSYLDEAAASWVSDPILIEAIRAQCEQTQDLSESEILEMDEAWRAEVGAFDMPTIDSVVMNSGSDFLRARVDDSAGVVSEIFVMDCVGLNVAASGITSDYWQGDEAKFIETFSKGPDAIHLSELELDESTQTYQIQGSMPVIDPASNEVVGAITIGLDAEAL